MGKKNKKKKTGAGMEKTMQKNAKKVDKELKRALKSGEADDIDAILDDFKAAEAARSAVSIVASSGPSPRCNGTMVVHPSKDELIIYGGEMYNGQKVVTFGDLFLYNTAKNEFRSVASPNSPPPRNSHQAVAVSMRGGQMWIFGGEFTSPKQQFRHYNDLWVLHLSNMSWEQVSAKNAPSPRSGHRMIEHKNKLIVFGGFFDGGASLKYLDDMFVFDLETMVWSKIRKPDGSAGDGSWPSARSGFCFAVHEASSTALLYGGFCTTLADAPLAAASAAKQGTKGQAANKQQQGGNKSGNKSNDKTAAAGHTTGPLSDYWSLDLTTYVWTRLKRSQAPHASTVCTTDSIRRSQQLPLSKVPCQRAGTTLTVVKDQAVMFGGVSDVEDTAVDIKSVHHNDVYLYNIPRKLWSLSVTPHVVTLSSTAVQPTPTPDGDSNTDTARRPQVISSAPHPRRNAMLASKKNSVYVFGGVFEAGKDKEIYFGDIFQVDVRKLQAAAADQGHKGNKEKKTNDSEQSASTTEQPSHEKEKGEEKKEAGLWTCMVPMDFSEYAWLGADDAVDDDDEEEDEEDEEEDEEEEDYEEEEEDDDNEEEEEDDHPDGAEVKEATGPRARTGEKLADFFERSKDHWMALAAQASSTPAQDGDAASEATEESILRGKQRKKEVRKVAFALAKDAFDGK